jgi:hypothetical protein
MLCDFPCDNSVLGSPTRTLNWRRYSAQKEQERPLDRLCLVAYTRDFLILGRWHSKAEGESWPGAVI